MQIAPAGSERQPEISQVQFATRRANRKAHVTQTDVWRQCLGDKCHGQVRRSRVMRFSPERTPRTGIRTRPLTLAAENTVTDRNRFNGFDTRPWSSG
jgi:hypothetical protein